MQTEVLAIKTAGTDAEVTMVRGKVVHSRWARNVLTFLMVFGPGLIVMEADNDAGAVSTYIQAGAQYGTRLLWLLLLLLPVTYFHPGDGRPPGDCHRQRPRGHDLPALRQVVGCLLAL